MMKTLFPLAAPAALLLAVTCAPVSAAETLDPVIVTPTRSAETKITTPGDIRIIDRREIEESGADNVADLLRGIASIQGQSRGTDADTVIGMRGFLENAHSNVLVLVDGRRLNNPDIAPPDFRSISLKDVEQIEIVHGSASTLYGDQAVAGVINIITKRSEPLESGQAQRTQFTYRSRAGSYDRFDIDGSIDHRRASGLYFRASGETRGTDNYRDHNRNENDNVVARAGWETANGETFVEASYSGDDLDLPGGLSQDQRDDDRQQAADNDEVKTIDRAYRWVGNRLIGPHWEVAAEVVRGNDDVRSVFSGTPFLQRRDQRSASPRLTGTLPFGKRRVEIVSGIDWLSEDYETQSPLFGDTRTDQEKRDAYVQFRVPTDLGRVVLGARYGDVEADFSGASDDRFEDDQLAWEVGLNSQLSADLRVYARTEATFRYPKSDEFTFTPAGDDLETQTGQSSSIGLNWARGGHKLGLALYYIDLDNEILFLPSATGPPPFGGANVNLDESERLGLTLDGEIAVTQSVTLTASASALDSEGRFQQQEFDQIPLAAEFTARLGLDWRIHEQLMAGVAARHVGERPVGSDFDESADELPAHTVTDINMRWAGPGLTLHASVNNLFNELYEEQAFEGFGGVSFFPMPERNFWLGLEFSL